MIKQKILPHHNYNNKILIIFKIDNNQHKMFIVKLNIKHINLNKKFKNQIKVSNTQIKKINIHPI